MSTIRWPRIFIALAGKTVHIVGTGNCDGYGIETVNHIELK